MNWRNFFRGMGSVLNIFPTPEPPRKRTPIRDRIPIRWCDECLIVLVRERHREEARCLRRNLSD